MATRKGTETRERILDAAEALVLEAGFGSTSIDRVIEAAGITKGAFFYHFGSKADMGHALVERYARRDQDVLESTAARVDKLAGDRAPLERLLLFLRLAEEHAESVTGPNPGCLFASYVYEAQLFDARTMDVIREQFLSWRGVLRKWLDRVAAVHPPHRAVDLDEVADLFSTVFEGAFVMAKSLEDPKLIARHLAHYRRYVELLFAPEPASVSAGSGAAAPASA